MNLTWKNIKRLCGMICVCILFYWCLEHFPTLMQGFLFLRGILMPFIIGAVMAFIINVPMRPLEDFLYRLKVKKRAGQTAEHSGGLRAAALLLTLLGFVLVVVFVVSIVVPELYRTFHQLFRQLPLAANHIYQWLEGVAREIPGGYLESAMEYLPDVNWASISRQAIAMARNILSGLAFSGIGVINSVVGTLTSGFIGFIFAIYLLTQKEVLCSQGKQLLYAWLPEQRAARVVFVLRLTNQTFSRFVRGQCLEAFILACMFFVSMTLFRMPYTLLVSVVICVTALIPILGSFIGCAVGIFLIAIVSPVQALAFLVLFLVLQQIEGNLIYPHVVGNSVGLPGIWTLVAVTLGGGLMGIAGMLIFIPLSSVLYQLLRLGTKQQLEKKKLSPDALP